MNIFKRLTSGDSASWNDLPWIDSQSHAVLGSDQWTLTYQLRGPAQLTLVAVADGEGWTTSMTTEQSATLAPGPYKWVACLSMPNARRSIGDGTLIIRADLSQIDAPIDARTMARKALDDCEACLAAFTATKQKIMSYSINGRETRYYTLESMLLLRDLFQRKVNNEAARQAVRNGRANPRELLVRFQ